MDLIELPALLYTANVYILLDYSICSVTLNYPAYKFHLKEPQANPH